MKFSVETWAPEYGTPTDENELDDSSDGVQVDLEIDGASWAPITPNPTHLPPELLFVDGVRRIDARVWIVDGDRVLSGVCATVGAGIVRCTATDATVVNVQIRRGLFSGPTEAAEDIQTRHGTYRYIPCVGDSAEDLYLGIHTEMTRLETRLSTDGYFTNDSATNDSVTNDSATNDSATNDSVTNDSAAALAKLVVFDGPLRGRTELGGVGYVKTQHVQYLPDEVQPTLSQLDAGQRTPLFLIAGRGFNRYSWYLRLPAERTQPWAGIVRCEIAAVGPVADAIDRADQVTAVLPRYASEPHKDGRAPQNLYPIAGLEAQLRRRLGDPLLMERALRIAAHRA